jgi:HD-GYP domain-containing protein (c-di-GMP phosphodiesterase class II)
MTETIPVKLIEKGMFVLELDRPWMGTPFLLQGFLVEDDEQIADLHKYCQQVTIDRSRSVGWHFRVPPVSKKNILPKLDASSRDATVIVTRDDTPDYGSIFKNLRDTPQTRRRRKPPRRDEGRYSRLDEELLFSTPIVDDVKQKLHNIQLALQTSATCDLTEVVGLVGDMAEAVERNPDAMILLARLRSTDEYSYDHAVDVSVHLMVLARFMGMPPSRIEMLGQIGLMQDIGKTKVPEGLLGKAEALTARERALVKSHVVSSIKILADQPGFSQEALAIVGSHHERFDGSGYPRRIKGERISLYAELAGLVDTYCAMLRKRAYRDAISSQEALESLNAVRDTQFRGPLVDQLIQCIGIYPVGSLVELNSAEVAVVIEQNQVRRLQPRVMIVLAPDKSVEKRAPTFDLMYSPSSPTGEPYRIVRSLPMNAYGVNAADYYLG